MLLCVTPEDANETGVGGGNTAIHTFGGSKIFDTTTPCWCAFRKDLEHKGLELKRGEKHVITANLWAVRKKVSKQVLLVTFPGE